MVRHGEFRKPRAISIRNAMIAGLIAVGLIAVAISAGCYGNRREVVSGGARRNIATVNNEHISLDKFREKYRQSLEDWERFVINDSTKRADLGRIVLERMIDRKLLDQEVRRRGITLDEQVFRKNLERSISPVKPTALAAAVKKKDWSVKSWFSSMRRRALHEKLIRQQVFDDIEISAEDLRAYYGSHRSEFVQAEQVRVRHIAVGNRSTYNRVVRLLNKKTSFIKLVKEFSTTPDRDRDGDLGYVERGVLPEAIDKVIFKLNAVGSINRLKRPVQTQMGYHIFKLIDRKPQAKLKYKQALELIREKLLDRRRPEVYRAWLDNLREQATIRVDYKLLTEETG